jgi:hypothetical protein
MVLLHTTQNGVQIHVEKGTKTQSPYDFIVKFLEPGKRLRTPTHVHLIVELYVKKAYNSQLTNQLVSYLLQVFQQLQPINYYPPKFQVFNPKNAIPYTPLNGVGEFSVEFLLAVSELIFIQEKTNYPRGSLTESLYKNFMTKDRFSVIQQAVFRG